MGSQTFLLQLLGILVVSRVFAEIAVRLKSPAVIGELLAGVVLGPSLLGWIAPAETFRMLAEIGIILLLFEVGLETDVMKLVQAGPQSILVAISGFVLPFILGFALCYFAFDLKLLVSLFVAGTITATSIGITIRVLSDLHRQHSHEAQVILGAAVIDDILGILLLALLYEFSASGNIDLIESGKVLIFILLFFLLAPASAKMVSSILHRVGRSSELPGLIPISIVSLVLFFAWLAHAIGAPELLGGFAAGLALSRRFFLPFGLALHSNPEFNEQVEKQMKPVISLFTPIFFVVVGLSLDLTQIDWSSIFVYSFAGLLLIVAIAGKLAGALLLNRPLRERWAVGISMVPRGEVGLIFAELGRTNGILSNEVYAATIIVIALTTLLPPFVLKAYYRRHEGRISPQSEPRT